MKRKKYVAASVCHRSQKSGNFFGKQTLAKWEYSPSFFPHKIFCSSPCHIGIGYWCSKKGKTIIGIESAFVELFIFLRIIIGEHVTSYGKRTKKYLHKIFHQMTFHQWRDYFSSMFVDNVISEYRHQQQPIKRLLPSKIERKAQL